MPIPIVGTRHHPTAVALMAILPHGAKIHLQLDPCGTLTGIPHNDPTGIAVRFHRDDLKRISPTALLSALGPLGFRSDTGTLFAREWWHLGYIPAKWPRAGLVLPAEGTLCFTSRGAPQVEGV